ncbi:thioesterase II family protein [Shewanella surugensis]|uniref:thioesterase II family protein n=1 Tax=Shewanella surugensis TaxID=212020 RepID=UPI0028A29DB8|nr:thioesterase domain-containing protein [Shewanella surugensis]
MTSSSCFIQPNTKPNALLRLICFPYAGGSAAIFKHWQRFLPETVELVCFQPPGRSTRIDETPLDHMALLIDELMQHRTFITAKSYVFLVTV